MAIHGQRNFNHYAFRAVKAYINRFNNSIAGRSGLGLTSRDRARGTPSREFLLKLSERISKDVTLIEQDNLGPRRFKFRINASTGEACVEIERKCPTCGEWRDSSVFVYVYAGPLELREPAQTLICNSCARTHAFTCDRTGYRYLSSAFTRAQMEDGHFFCLEANRRNMIRLPSGIYRWSDPSRIIPGYHSEANNATRRDWVRRAVGDVFGIEVEVMAAGPDKLNDILNSVQEARFICERDGSLDDILGVEIIGPPTPLSEIQRADGAWPKLLAKLRSLKTRAEDINPHEDGDYGIHVSINKASLSPVVQARVITFINDQDELSKLVAERRNIYHGGYKKGRRMHHLLRCDRRSAEDIAAGHGRSSATISQRARSTNVSLRQPPSFIQTESRYEPVSVGETRLEVRIFKANISDEGFKKNVEYCAAVVDFCRVTMTRDMSEENFLNFVNAKPEKYKHLRSFLIKAGKIKEKGAKKPKKIKKIERKAGIKKDTRKAVAAA